MQHAMILLMSLVYMRMQLLSNAIEWRRSYVIQMIEQLDSVGTVCFWAKCSCSRLHWQCAAVVESLSPQRANAFDTRWLDMLTTIRR